MLGLLGTDYTVHTVPLVDQRAPWLRLLPPLERLHGNHEVHVSGMLSYMARKHLKEDK